jgi:hypothetical protein
MVQCHWSLLTCSSSIIGFSATVVVKVAQGAFRLLTLWKDISGRLDKFKTLLGWEGAMDAIPNASLRVCHIPRLPCVSTLTDPKI